ncbi:MAG: hypothetical protein OXU51_16315 [Candidatus Poribacteria bacterium]|nr:hypothetical protein [Candidatus Poribacteria bacterium]
MVSRLRILDPFPEADILAQKLLDAGAVPRNSLTDAQHIAIATVHSVEYLASWNHKHIVNENKREYINQVCQAAGFQPITICTPVELMEDIQMKEIPEKYMFRNATKDDLDKVAALYRDWVSEASTGGLVVDTVDDLLCRLGPHFRYFL